MRFLKTLLWVLIAVVLAIFGAQNWNDVTVSLWGNLQMDIKLPVLLLLAFLIGLIPIYVVMRGRLWSLKRRLAVAERSTIAPVPATVPAVDPIEDETDE